MFLLLNIFRSTVLSEVNINILGPYKVFWYTGSAFTRYFNHNNKQIDMYGNHRENNLQELT